MALARRLARHAQTRSATWACPALPSAFCFAIASTSFVVALAYTTVANILLDAGRRAAAGGPVRLGAVSRDASTVMTWVAIAAVIAGVAIMVSELLDGAVSPIGDGLALLIAFDVLDRHRHHPALRPSSA